MSNLMQTELAEALAMDAGQLSRLVKRPWFPKPDGQGRRDLDAVKSALDKNYRRRATRAAAAPPQAADVVDTGAAAPPLTPPADESIDAHALLEKAITDPSCSNEFRRTLSVVAGELRKRREYDERQALRVEPKAVIRMLHELHEFYCECVRQTAPAAVNRLLATIKTEIGVDLASKNSAAAGIITAALYANGNAVLETLKAHVQSECAKVKTK